MRDIHGNAGKRNARRAERREPTWLRSYDLDSAARSRFYLPMLLESNNLDNFFCAAEIGSLSAQTYAEGDPMENDARRITNLNNFVQQAGARRALFNVELYEI